MKNIIYFDYCALVILLLLLACVFVRKMTQSSANRVFLLMLVVCGVTTVSDITAVSLDGLGAGYVIGKYVFHTLYLFLHSLLPAMYFIYLVVRTDTMYKFQKSILQQVIFGAPVVLLFISLALNLSLKFIFYLDANDNYQRGPAFVYLYFVAIYYIVVIVRYLIIYRKTVAKSQFWTLLSLVPFIFLAAVVQFVYKHLLVEMFANTCGMLVIGLMIQRPEERIDSETGLQKLSAYVADMKRAFLLEKPVEIIMINVVNYNVLQELAGYDGVKEFKKQVVNQMHAINKKYRLGAGLYYLNGGKFRFVVSRNTEPVEIVAEQMVEFMRQKFHLSQMDMYVMSRVCITRCPEDLNDIDALLTLGNNLNSKNRGGEVIYAANEYKKEYRDLLRDIDKIIETALSERKFMIYYQPIYSVNDGRFLSAEALIRLKDEKYGFISPEVLIHAAEKSGAIHRIGEYVLEEVCKFISGEEFARLKLDYIEVNLSVVQCMNSKLPERVREILQKYHVRPEQVNLEITETAASYSQETIMKNIVTLSEDGILFSMDDFGSGYSNMRRIASMPFNLIKLDKSFINAENDEKFNIVLKNTIEMIKAMNMKIVVEGVETEQMLNHFVELKCEYIQGYYYSKPLPLDEFISFMDAATS